MVGFAFAIVIVVVMLLSLCRDKTYDLIGNSRMNAYERIKKGFLQSVAPSEEMLIAARENKDYSDLVEDMSYVLDRPVTEQELARYIPSYAALTALPWRSAALMIRLSKLGKYPSGYFETMGTHEILNSRNYFITKKVYELVAKNLNEHGVSTSVVEKVNPQFERRVVINLWQLCFENYEYARSARRK